MRVIHSARSVFAALLTHNQIRAMFQEFDNVPVGYRINPDGTKKKYVRSLACSHLCIVQPLTHFFSLIYKHLQQTWAVCSVLTADVIAQLLPPDFVYVYTARDPAADVKSSKGSPRTFGSSICTSSRSR